MCLHTHIPTQTHQGYLAGICGLNEKRPQSGWDKQVRKFNLTLPTPVIISRVWKGQICQDSRILGVWVAKPIWGPVCFVLTFAPDFSTWHWRSLLLCTVPWFLLMGGQSECDYPWLDSGVRSEVTCMDLLHGFGRTKKMYSLCLCGRTEPAMRAWRGQCNTGPLNKET